MALADVIPRISRSLAYLNVMRTGDAHGLAGIGTAFVAGASGHLVTAAHLLRDARRVEATLIGARAPVACEIVATDVAADVALLQPDAHGLTPALLSRRESIPIGREVAFMGFPHADLFDPPLIMTMRGIIGNRYRLGAVEYYVVDASASEGMSGGPLFLAETGEVVGVVGGRFDPGRTRAKRRGASDAEIHELPSERTNIVFAPAIEYALALLRRNR